MEFRWVSREDCEKFWLFLVTPVFTEKWRHERTLKTILRMMIINGFVATVKIKT
jgi:hypothetical protein